MNFAGAGRGGYTGQLHFPFAVPFLLSAPRPQWAPRAGPRPLGGPWVRLICLHPTKALGPHANERGFLGGPRGREWAATLSPRGGRVGPLWGGLPPLAPGWGAEEDSWAPPIRRGGTGAVRAGGSFAPSSWPHWLQRGLRDLPWVCRPLGGAGGWGAVLGWDQGLWELVVRPHPSRAGAVSLPPLHWPGLL